MSIRIFGSGGGVITDATAVTGNVERGKVFYNNNGRQVGTLDVPNMNDATAYSSDVISGKVFYNKFGRNVGSLNVPSIRKISINISETTIPNQYDAVNINDCYHCRIMKSYIVLCKKYNYTYTSNYYIKIPLDGEIPLDSFAYIKINDIYICTGMHTLRPTADPVSMNLYYSVPITDQLYLGIMYTETEIASLIIKSSKRGVSLRPIESFDICMYT